MPTHTSIDLPKARLYVPEERLDDFLREYQHAMLQGVSLHLTEKPTPVSIMPVDIDFRFLMPTLPGEPLQRLYNQEHVDRLLMAYFTVMADYVDDPTKLVAYVMEKPAPTEYRGKLKDGLHILFPHIVCSVSFKHLVRKLVLDQALQVFDGLPLCNNFEDIIDEAVIEHNNWQMYGSCKPNCPAYMVTGVYDFAEGAIKKRPQLTPTEELGLVSLLCMRNKREPIVYKPEKTAEIEEYTKYVLPTRDDRKKSKLHAQIFGKSVNNNKNHVSEDERQLARMLTLECVSSQRAERYDDWIKVGWCLRNIDIDLLETFVEFSRLSTKYIEGECQTLWNKMQTDTLGMGTLRWWARQDNPEQYRQLIDGAALTLIDRCIGSDGAHFDVARVIHAMFKDKYCYTCETWYVYDGNRHKWVRTREGAKLQLTLSIDVCEKFMERATYWNQQAAQAADEDAREACNSKFKRLLKIAQRLKNDSYKSSVIKQCKALFTNDKFDELLDAQPHLLGFENGVYDLRMHTFREGLPDDYISYGTGINYFPYNANTEEAQEIEVFLKQVFMNDGVRQYIKDVLASIIDGGVRHEKFYICTGTGSNAKSKLFELLQRCMGDYYCIIPIALLTQKRVQSNSAQSELERTKGRRLAVMQEPGESETLNIGLMKELTGGDRIMARALYKEPIEFKPQFKMVLTCNELPEVPSDDGGTWRRIRVVEFKSRFKENPDPSKPNEFPMDVELADKFDRWAETFMAMMISHHKSIDPKNIVEPPEVRIATESYKSNNDVIGQFAADQLVKVEDQLCRVQLNVAYGAFKTWALKFAQKSKKLPARPQLRAYLENAYGLYPQDGKGWKGYKLKSSSGEDGEEEAAADATAATDGASAATNGASAATNSVGTGESSKTATAAAGTGESSKGASSKGANKSQFRDEGVKKKR